MKGILITKGVTPGFLPGGIKLFDDALGTRKMSATMSLHYDVVGVWIRTALNSLRTARLAWKSAKERISVNVDDVAVELLETDFQHSMIVVVGFAISVDAFYARLSQFNGSPHAKSGNLRKAPRYAQVAEQFRLSYKVDNKIFSSIRLALKQLYELRDQAVHPSGKLAPAVLYPEIDRGVEVRFERFRSKVVSVVAQDSMNIIDYLTNKSEPINKKVEAFSKVTGKELQCIISEYPDIFTATPLPKQKIPDMT